jgi:hypothetical protein
MFSAKKLISSDRKLCGQDEGSRIRCVARYVACTRARDHLFVTGVNPASEFLDDLTR